MKFAYTILYVRDAARSLAFYETAFGLQRRFLHESGTYGELETGTTTLAFAAEALAESNFPGGFSSWWICSITITRKKELLPKLANAHLALPCSLGDLVK